MYCLFIWKRKKEEADYEAAHSSYYFNTYQEYYPKLGNELIIVNITIGIDSEEDTPLDLSPSDFNFATSSGVKITSGKNWVRNNFEYYNSIDFETDGLKFFRFDDGKELQIPKENIQSAKLYID